MLSRQDGPDERGHQGDRGQERTKAVPDRVVKGRLLRILLRPH